MRTDPNPDVATAFRRAALQHHHRTLTAELEASPDRTSIATALDDVDHPASVVVVRLDGFDGGSIDDEVVLDQVGSRLRSIVREPLGVHRLGASFVVVLAADRYVAAAVARRAVAALAEPFSVGAFDMTLTAATGIADVDPADPLATIQRADLAALRDLLSRG